MISLTSALFVLACSTASVAQAANLLVSHYTGNLYSLTLNTNNGANGQLSLTSTLKAGGGMPSWLTLDSSSKTVYVTDESQYPSPVLTSLQVQSDNSLRTISTLRTPGGELHSAYYGGSNGKGFLATAEYATSSIATFKLPLSSATKFLQQLKFTMSAKGPNPSRQDAPHPHGVFVDPTGNFLLAPDLGADLIRIFAINQSTGNLTACTAAKAPAGDGPRHGVFYNASSTSGSMFYTVNELGNSVGAYSVSYPINNSGGCLSLNHTQTLSTYPAGITPPSASKAAEVHIAGNFLYAINRNDQSFGSRNDSIATYAIDSTTGAVSFVQSSPAYTYFPRTFQINRAGDMVAIGGQTSSTVAIVKRNVTTGALGGLVAPVLSVGQAGTYNNEDGLSAVIWNE